MLFRSFRFDTIPGSKTPFIHIVNAANNVAIIGAQITTSGKIATFSGGASEVTGTSTLSVNTWYRISLSYTITNSTTYTIKTYVDGNLDSTLSNTGTLSSTGTDRLKLRANTGFGNNANCWFDNVYVDNRSDLTDCGDIRVTAKRPAANNTNNFDTAIGASPANRWTNVNEVPLKIGRAHV